MKPKPSTESTLKTNPPFPLPSNSIQLALSYNNYVFRVNLKFSDFNIKTIESLVKSTLKLKNDFYIIYFIDAHDSQIIIQKNEDLENIIAANKSINSGIDNLQKIEHDFENSSTQILPKIEFNIENFESFKNLSNSKTVLNVVKNVICERLKRKIIHDFENSKSITDDFKATAKFFESQGFSNHEIRSVIEFLIDELMGSFNNSNTNSVDGSLISNEKSEVRSKSGIDHKEDSSFISNRNAFVALKTAKQQMKVYLEYASEKSSKFEVESESKEAISEKNDSIQFSGHLSPIHKKQNSGFRVAKIDDFGKFENFKNQISKKTENSFSSFSSSFLNSGYKNDGLVRPLRAKSNKASKNPKFYDQKRNDISLNQSNVSLNFKDNSNKSEKMKLKIKYDDIIIYSIISKIPQNIIKSLK